MKSAFPTVKLSEIAYLNPTLGGRLPEDELVSFVPMASVSAETAKVETTQDRPYSEVSKGFTPFLSGDVLFAKITPCFENGKIAQANLPRQNGFGSTEFHVVRSRPGVSDARYLHHYLRLKEVRTEGRRRMTGSGGQRRVPASFLSELRIPVPSLDEQRHIAAVLDQAETLRTQRRVALAQLDSLTQSLFLDMFGDPVANDRRWPEALTLGEVADIASGVTKGRKLEGKITRELPYLAVANVQDKSLRLDGVKSIDATEDEIQRYRLQRNDLLLTEGGDPDKLGRGTLWNDELPECIHQNHIFRVRLTTRLLTPLFLNWIVGSSRGKKYFLRSAKQTTGIASINMTQLKGFPLLVPPLALQQTFAIRIQAIEALKVTHRAALNELDALFSSLQHQAFSGELTQSASPVQVLRTKAHDFSELCKLDAGKGLEALIYVARRMPEHHFYKSLKALYFADKHQLEHQGRLIYGETHCALPMGPVPQAAYDAAKVLSGELLVSAFDDDGLRASLRRTDKELIPLRDADPAKLSTEERASLDWAISYVAPMSFDQVKTASHDSAYERTPRNQPIQLEHMIEMLPEAAKQQFFA